MGVMDHIRAGLTIPMIQVIDTPTTKITGGNKVSTMIHTDQRIIMMNRQTVAKVYTLNLTCAHDTYST